MAEDRNVVCTIKDGLGEVHISEEVVARIAAVAATEVRGVSAMAGNITRDLIYKLPSKYLAKGVKVEMIGRSVSVSLALKIYYEYSIPKTAAKVQEKVKSAIETMTGLSVNDVNIKIVAVDMDPEPAEESTHS